VIVSPELQEIDAKAAHVVKGYAIEGEVALVIRTSSDEAEPVHVIAPALDRNKMAQLLRNAAKALES
jgi:L-lactate utilization protein LutB